MAISVNMRWIAATVVLCSLLAVGQFAEDKPCERRRAGLFRSIVCVCNSTYCDTITRENPARGTYVVYTSTHGGKRFEKSYGTIKTLPEQRFDDPGDLEPEPEPIQMDFGAGELKNLPDPPFKQENDDNEEDEDDDEDSEEFKRVADRPELYDILTNVVLRIYPSTRYQVIEGFGGSVTDAAAINWRTLSEATQETFIQTYFGPEGIEYNMIRVPIAGCDFSEYPYTYAESPWNDATLSNFSLTHHDFFLKLPMIKRAQSVAPDEIKITASTWSPPIWMKTNEAITGFAQLKREYYQAFADYHLRFIEEYDRFDVKIWAITTTNEPINGIVPFVQFNSLGWFPHQLGRWLADNLGPTIKNSRFNQTKILAIDDQRYLLPVYLAGMELAAPESIDYMDGVAVHWYGNFFPPQILSAIQNRYPDKILLATEACEGSMPWNLDKVILGSWRRAGTYVKSILQDLNNHVVGWIDWNLCLDPIGGPNWVDNFVDSPILVYKDRDEFIKQPMFYAMGHFSKFIPRGSRRVRVSRRSIASIENVAVRKPNGNLVVVMQNRRRRPMNVEIRISSSRYIDIIMEPRSIKTIEINP
ncbi:glucosylceramidase-like [Spodoptera litura]|uniref:Glucosylceramidase n=1 Tax=Spodoptera litura TaxID=69820 RepID=A0A9J7IXT4_SPOLT|nr:glucosylceramidase-like [Spodoptera litura]XP_022829499.1 glucosylceramidase-like [Spodoptera litura]